MVTTESQSIVFYQTENADVVVNVVYKDETFWLTQKAMAELFDVNPQAITKHLSNIYEEGELSYDATCSILEQVQTEGKRQVKRQREVRGEHIKKSQIYSSSAVAIMTKTARQQKISTLSFRTSFILQ